MSLMGETLYRLFVYHYTVKQWGVEPRPLSAEMAARRVHLRTDGDRRLYRDAWEHFPPDGANTVIEAVLQGIPVHLGAEVRLGRSRRRAVAGRSTPPSSRRRSTRSPGEATALPWRGIRVHARYCETDAAGGDRDARLHGEPARPRRAVHAHRGDQARERPADPGHRRVRGVPGAPGEALPGADRAITSTSAGTASSRRASAASPRCPSPSAGGSRTTSVHQPGRGDPPGPAGRRRAPRVALTRDAGARPASSSTERRPCRPAGRDAPW